MAMYSYKAITDKGVIIKNTVEAASKQELIRKLKRNNINPILVEETSPSFLSGSNNKTKKNTVDVNDLLKNSNQGKNHLKKRS